METKDWMIQYFISLIASFLAAYMVIIWKEASASTVANQQIGIFGVCAIVLMGALVVWGLSKLSRRKKPPP
jgi:predicted membrane channel-forming protein YqfA (hemolysin III family)